MKKLNIITYPNPILDNISAKVSLPLNTEDQDLIRSMWQTVQGEGIGLAAPQVGINKQICLVHLDPEIADKKDKNLDFIMINPEITFYSDIQCKMVEGCLSFPEQFWDIKRPSNIIVKFVTIANFKAFLKGKSPVLKPQIVKAKSWMARVIQHEVDHLNGNLFVNLGGEKLEPEKAKDRQIID
jgi:peptide deformylase